MGILSRRRRFGVAKTEQTGPSPVKRDYRKLAPDLSNRAAKKYFGQCRPAERPSGGRMTRPLLPKTKPHPENQPPGRLLFRYAKPFIDKLVELFLGATGDLRFLRRINLTVGGFHFPEFFVLAVDP